MIAEITIMREPADRLDRERGDNIQKGEIACISGRLLGNTCVDVNALAR